MPCIYEILCIKKVNCETDFVARNSKFHGLVSKVTGACLEWGKERTENKVFEFKKEPNE